MHCPGLYCNQIQICCVCSVPTAVSIWERLLNPLRMQCKFPGQFFAPSKEKLMADVRETWATGQSWANIKKSTGKRDMTFQGEGADSDLLLPESCEYVRLARTKMCQTNTFSGKYWNPIPHRLKNLPCLTSVSKPHGQATEAFMNHTRVSIALAWGFFVPSDCLLLIRSSYKPLRDSSFYPTTCLQNSWVCKFLGDISISTEYS